ncbi:MAG: ComF family protein [Candidatus Poribacteria bacterium]|nr:ComF family protein [Candidatus Poribacteria bacterium]
MQLRPSIIHQTIESAVSFIYPAQCRVCRNVIGLESIPYVCDTCWENLEVIVPPWCEICGISNTDGVCADCATNPPKYGKLRTIGIYDGTLQQLIHLYKFEKRTSLVKHLVQLIFKHLPEDLPIDEYDYILPIPIHKKRLRERGFNQTTLLAEHISKKSNNPILRDALIREKNTSPQSGLDREARQTNIIGAFSLRKSEAICNRKILVLDDVFTTGATVREAVKVLWNADPIEVDVLTLARAVNPI